MIGEGAGAVVPAGRPEALARALTERLTNPSLAASEGARARERVEAAHDVARTRVSMVAAYEEALSRRG